MTGANPRSQAATRDTRDQLLNRPHHAGRLGRNGAVGAQVLKQRPNACRRQPPAIAPKLAEEGAHRLVGELIDRERSRACIGEKVLPDSGSDHDRSRVSIAEHGETCLARNSGATAVVPRGAFGEKSSSRGTGRRGS
jgi:hypothetical protein